MQRKPMPEPDAWRAIDDPQQRLRTGLAELFAFYEASEAMLANVIRDAETDPLVSEIAALRMAAIADLRDALLEGLKRKASAPQLQAALDLAIDFDTWRLLVRRSNLRHDQAIELLVAMLRCLR
jgi:hypothetical protein